MNLRRHWLLLAFLGFCPSLLAVGEHVVVQEKMSLDTLLTHFPSVLNETSFWCGVTLSSFWCVQSSFWCVVKLFYASMALCADFFLFRWRRGGGLFSR
jgi:hypothetical protein